MCATRLLVAVEPLLMEAVLARLLTEWRELCVVQYHGQPGPPPDGDFDAVITSGGLPPGVTGATHIRLPLEARAGTAIITTGEDRQEAAFGSYRDLFDMLERAL